MLYRKLLIALSLGLCAVAHGGDAFEQATHNPQARHQETTTLFEQAESLSHSATFIEQIEHEANQALESGAAYLSQPLPPLPAPSPEMKTPEMKTRAHDDLTRLLDQANSSAPTVDDGAAHSGAQLYLFVSFAMPEQSLKKLLRQAASINATLVLRGLVNGDLAKTKTKIAEILESDGQGRTAISAGFAIDPTLFERFKVNTVPTFVLTEAPAERCTEQVCPVPTHARLSGDLTLSYVLETMAREAPALSSQAQTMRDRLGSGG